MLADASWIPAIGVRWLHVISACLLVGATFFMYAIVPVATRGLDEQARDSVAGRLRRGFKMIVHSTMLLLIVSGAYNAWSNWQAYKNNMPWTHALFGPHLLLGLIIFAILLVILAGRAPRRNYRAWLAVAVVLMFMTVAIASSLKYAREHPTQHAVRQT